MMIKSNRTASLIKSRRIELGLTQSDLHKKLGWKVFNTQYISNIELGKCQLPPKHINNFATAIGIDNQIILDAMVLDYKDSLINQLGR